MRSTKDFRRQSAKLAPLDLLNLQQSALVGPAPRQGGYGTANAARVSCGQHEDYWPGLRIREPRPGTLNP